MSLQVGSSDCGAGLGADDLVASRNGRERGIPVLQSLFEGSYCFGSRLGALDFWKLPFWVRDLRGGVATSLLVLPLPSEERSSGDKMLGVGIKQKNTVFRKP